MYVGCRDCGYDSGDKGSRIELIEKVEADGGKLSVWNPKTGNYEGEDECPKCKSKNLTID